MIYFPSSYFVLIYEPISFSELYFKLFTFFCIPYELWSLTWFLHFIMINNPITFVCIPFWVMFFCFSALVGHSFLNSHDDLWPPYLFLQLTWEPQKGTDVCCTDDTPHLQPCSAEKYTNYYKLVFFFKKKLKKQYPDFCNYLFFYFYWFCLALQRHICWKETNLLKMTGS